MIDLEVLREAIADCNRHKNGMMGIYLTADEANDILDMLKDPDRIKVVRCKDCRRKGTFDCPIYASAIGRLFLPENWYCASGEVKE